MHAYVFSVYNAKIELIGYIGKSFTPVEREQKKTEEKKRNIATDARGKGGRTRVKHFIHSVYPR